MAGILHGLALAEQFATAGCGAANAAYFAARACRAHGARRVAAGVLALLFAGSILASLAGGSGAAEALMRAPLLAANVATIALLWAGAGR